MSIKIISPAFAEGGMIPPKYTCDGANISPPLHWENIPNNTETLALTCNDPDTPKGNWIHWLVYNIPPAILFLDENQQTDVKLKNGAIQGLNDFGNIGYGGPCPPRGIHRYFIRLFALNFTIDFTDTMNYTNLIQKMEGHILSEGLLIGRYERRI